MEGSNLKTNYADANSFLYMVHANQAFNIENEISKLKSPILFISASTDLLFPPELTKAAAAKINQAGGSASVTVIDGIGGHLAGLFSITNAAPEISRFLNNAPLKK